jgi:2-succinyl-6-hydroxy-2,4-cyclohexadiene-1-carboxylate synthase
VGGTRIQRDPVKPVSVTVDERHHRVWRWNGPTSALPIVALHGFTGTGRDFAVLAPQLGRTILAPDLVGHGETDAPAVPGPYRMVQVVEQLLAVIRSTVPSGSFILLGYSMGGRTALHLAAQVRERLAGLVLIGAHPGLRDPAARVRRHAEDTALAADIEDRGMAWFQAEWASRPIIATQQRIRADALRQMTRHRANNRPHGLAHSLREMGLGAMPSAWPVLPGIDAPCRVIVGAEDHRFSALAAEMVAQLAQAEQLTIAGAGHCAHLEQPDETARQLTPFMTGLQAGAGDG